MVGFESVGPEGAGSVTAVSLPHMRRLAKAEGEAIGRLVTGHVGHQGKKGWSSILLDYGPERPGLERQPTRGNPIFEPILLAGR
jgi:hypothetical protein